MTPEEAMKRLEELGIDMNTWGDKEADGVQPPFVGAQVQQLAKLRDALEGEVGKLQSDSSRARETLLRLKHGGGI